MSSGPVRRVAKGLVLGLHCRIHRNRAQWILHDVLTFKRSCKVAPTDASLPDVILR